MYFIFFGSFNLLRHNRFLEQINVICHSYLESVCIHMILCWIFLLVGVPVGVTIESLQCFAFLCFHSEDRLSIQLLAEFSSVLIPLTSDNKVWMQIINIHY
jgi:hypothetical protein